MTAYIAQAFNTQFFDGATVAAGYSLYTYDSGTVTPKTVYKNQAGTVAHTNPIVLDADGMPPGGTIWITSGEVTFVLKDLLGATVWTRDDIAGSSSSGDVSALRADLANNTDVAKGAALVGYKGRTVFDRLAEHASVFDFGAVGDGVTDDTDAIQAAVDASRNVYFPTPPVYYRTTRPIRIGRFRRLYGDVGQYYQTSATPTYERIGAVIRKVGSDPFVPGGSWLGDGPGFTQDLNVNCIFLLHEIGWPYRATDVIIENLGLEGDSGLPVASRPYGILAFRATKSAFKNINMTSVLDGIQGNEIDYTGIGKTDEGTGNNLDSYLNKVENVTVEAANVGFDSAGTSWEYDRCYSLGAIVGYRTEGNYTALINCACDGSTDIAYWNTGSATYIGCGQEGTQGNQLRDDGTAWINGWQVTNSGSVTRITAYNTAAYSATRALTAGDAAYNAVFSPTTVYTNADLGYDKATTNNGTQLGYKGTPAEFDNIRHSADGSTSFFMNRHGGRGMPTVTLLLHAVNSTYADPITRAQNYASGSFIQVGTIKMVDMGSMWLVAGFVNLSSQSADNSPVRICIESGASRYTAGNNNRYEFLEWSTTGMPNYGVIPAAGTFADPGVGRRGSVFRTLDFVKSTGGGWSWSRVGGYDPTDGLIYMFNSSTGAQMKYNDAGVADSWTFTGWLPKVFPEIPTV